MFGLNDSSQNQSNNAAGGGTPPVLPPSPFGSGSDMAPPLAPSPMPYPPPSQSAFSPSIPSPSADVKPVQTSQHNGDLLDLKQEALQKLQPLVGHLDQTPEEKFRTTMMMIQATDNPSLVKQAYDLASQITDEKARAQALLDIVNEINYFTQNDKVDPPAQNPSS